MAGTLEMEQGSIRTKNWLVLSLLTLAFVFGEMGHFLLGVTSREMAGDIHFGDLGCLDQGCQK